jgi:hypothetical protein
MIKIITFLLILFFENTYSQVVVCYGTTKSYSVDTVDGVNGTVGSNYSWQIKNADGTINTIPIITTTTSSGNGISINWGATAVGIYTIEVVESNSSCSAPPVTLSVNIKANPSVNVSDIAVCLNSNTNIIATPSPPGGTYGFNWSTPGAYAGLLNTNTIDIAGAKSSLSGNYTVFVTDVDGCVSSPSTALLTVNSLPDATVVAATSTTFCIGGNVNLTAPTNVGLSYQWNKDGTAILNQTGQTYMAVQTGIYTVTTKDANACSNTFNPGITVTVNPLPVISIAAGGPVEFCDGFNVVLTPTITVGSAPFSYQWINSSGNILLATSTTHTAISSSNYKVRVADVNACEAISPGIDVAVRSNPDSSITALSATTFCAGDNVMLKSGIGSVSGFTYQWMKETVDITGANQFDYMVNESGNYKVRVIDTNFSTNCNTTTTSAIVINKTELPITSIIKAY